MTILVLTTGGSVDKIYDVLGELVVGAPQVREILAEGACLLDVDVREVMRKDSLDITDADRSMLRELVAGTPHRHLVIMHGTDTMPETARALGGIDGKVIVLTGALQPYAMRRSDAAFNLGTALGAMETLSPGVYVAMGGRILSGAAVRKDRRRGTFGVD